MEAVLLRTGSIVAQAGVVPSSPTVSLSRQDSLAGVLFSGEKMGLPGSPGFSLHLEMNCRRETPGRPIRRALSESDVTKPLSRLSSAGSRSFPVMIHEEEFGSFAKGRGDRPRSAGIWPERGIPLEDLGFREEGFGNGTDFGAGDGCDRSGKGGFGSGGHDGDRRNIGDYYREMLKSNPSDPLLLRNYGKYLHEVEKDPERAEEYYGRATLANPGDGEVLSMYAKLIWETHGDGDRAESYFNRAVLASPDDCAVLGSYAHFLWETEEEEGEGEDAAASDETAEAMKHGVGELRAMVAAF